MDRFADMFLFYACLLDVRCSWQPVGGGGGGYMYGGLPRVAMGGACGLDSRWCTLFVGYRIIAWLVAAFVNSGEETSMDLNMLVSRSIVNSHAYFNHGYNLYYLPHTKILAIRLVQMQSHDQRYFAYHFK